MKALAILIDPKGEEYFLACGPHTKNRAEATEFASAEIALKAARAAIFGDPLAFWNSERESARRTREEHRGWSFRIEEIQS